jgi:hypothetical protein
MVVGGGGVGVHCGRRSIHFNINLTLSSPASSLPFHYTLLVAFLRRLYSHLCNKSLVLLLFKQTHINISFMLLYPNVPSPLQKSPFSSYGLLCYIFLAVNFVPLFKENEK